MKEVVGPVAFILTIIGHVPYIVDILKGKTKPHIFTWIIWSIVTVLVFIGQWSETLFTYALNILRHALSIVALANYNLATYLYPCALLFMNLAMRSIILRSKYKK